MRCSKSPKPTQVIRKCYIFLIIYSPNRKISHALEKIKEKNPKGSTETEEEISGQFHQNNQKLAKEINALAEKNEEIRGRHELARRAETRISDKLN